MDPITSWFKTNAIIILGVICAVQLLLGSVATLWLSHELKAARADLAVTTANYAVCSTANEAWKADNDARNAQVAENQRLAAAALATAQGLNTAARATAGTITGAANALAAAHSTKPTDCDRAREYVDAFYATKGAKP